MHIEKMVRPAGPSDRLYHFLLVSILAAAPLALVIPSGAFGAGTVLLGSQAIADTPDSNQPGKAEAFQFTATASGTLGSLTVYLDTSSSSTRLIAGLYAGAGQNPGALLTQGSITSPTAGAWNTISVPPVSVTAGTVYWITILGTGGTLKFRDTGANCVSQSSLQTNLTALPATWSVGSRWFSCTVSAYGSSSASGPALSVSLSALSFSATQGSGTNPAPSSVSVTNTGGGTLNFTTGSDAPWLSVTPASGTAPPPQSLQVSATLGTLTAGVYTGHVTVTSIGTQGSPATITVTFNVAAPAPPPPVLSVSLSALTFGATQGSGTSPAPSSVSVTNTGGGALAFTAGSDAPWLSVTPASGNAPQSLQISATLGSLTSGTYTGHVTVSAAGVQGSPATITVTFNVAAPGPVLATSPAALTFSATQGSGTSPAPSSVSVTNTGGGALTFTAGSDAPWLSVTPASGNAPQSLQVAATLGTLTVGTYTGHVTVTATGAQNSPASMTVTFNVAADVAPVISGAGASSITSTGALVSWTTDKPASSLVNYGTSPAYGSSSSLDQTLVAAHAVTLSGLAAGTLYHYQVQSADSLGTSGASSDLTFSTSGTSSSCPCSIWSGTTIPGTPSVNDSQAVELGVKFTSDVTGYITGIRFYKSSKNTGTHTGSLWTSSGTRLATATFTGETGTGWQQVTFASPVAINANTTYVASYHSNAGFYAGDSLFFASAAVNQPPLHALANGTSGGNGVYVYGGGGAFPGSSYQSSNYWVDVVFNPSQGGLPTTYSISGSVSGASGATVTLSGAAHATTTVDTSGNFSFSGLANGSYTVAPSQTGLTFAPVSRSATVNNANVTGLAFASTVPTYTISGVITAGSGATVALTGAGSATTIANASGNFSFSGLPNGSYTITPSKSGFAISPSTQSVTVTNANVSGVSFTATALTYSISGVLSPATGGGGAVVALSGATSASTTADMSGNYSFAGLFNGNYALTPSHSGYTFSPTSRAATVNGANVTGMNFTDTVVAPTYTVSGTISPASIGAGSVVRLSGSGSGQTTAGSNGNFSFASLQNGTYRLTPSNSSDTFTPTSQLVTVNGGNVTGVNFTVQGQQQGAGTPATVGAWYVLNEAADVHSGTSGCFSPSQVNFAPNNTTITMIQGKFTCGFTGSSSGTGTITQDYLSGALMWHDLNFVPSSGHTIVIEVKAELGRGWPSIWLLGGDKAANTGCQVSTPMNWDNTGTCNWPQDIGANGDSAEIDIEETTEQNGYTHLQGNVYANGQSNGVANNIPGGANATQGFHLYHFDWSTTRECWGIDGVSNGCVTGSPLPKNPMFLIIENAVSPSGAPPSFPQVMTIQYVQVCDAGTGSTCSTPGVDGGNTIFFDNFTDMVGAEAKAKVTRP